VNLFAQNLFAHLEDFSQLVLDKTILDKSEMMPDHLQKSSGLLIPSPSEDHRLPDRSPLAKYPTSFYHHY
jgi:hypothetical protein